MKDDSNDVARVKRSQSQGYDIYVSYYLGDAIYPIDNNIHVLIRIIPLHVNS